MGIYVSTVQWASIQAGKVLALVHPGGLFSSSITIKSVTLEWSSDHELRVKLSRYNTKATGGALAGSAPFVDNASSSSIETRFGAVSWPDNLTLSWPMRIRPYDEMANHELIASGELTLAPNHTLVLEVLDAVPFAANAPMTWRIAWKE